MVWLVNTLNKIWRINRNVPPKGEQNSQILWKFTISKFLPPTRSSTPGTQTKVERVNVVVIHLSLILRIFGSIPGGTDYSGEWVFDFPPNRWYWLWLSTSTPLTFPHFTISNYVNMHQLMLHKISMWNTNALQSHDKGNWQVRTHSAAQKISNGIFCGFLHYLTACLYRL